jgi:hypothetical protein
MDGSRMIFWLVVITGLLFAIANLLNEILGELKLAKRDREDAHSQGRDEHE